MHPRPPGSAFCHGPPQPGGTLFPHGSDQSSPSGRLRAPALQASQVGQQICHAEPKQTSWVQAAPHRADSAAREPALAQRTEKRVRLQRRQISRTRCCSYFLTGAFTRLRDPERGSSLSPRPRGRPVSPSCRCSKKPSSTVCRRRACCSAAISRPFPFPESPASPPLGDRSTKAPTSYH